MFLVLAFGMGILVGAVATWLTNLSIEEEWKLLLRIKSTETSLLGRIAEEQVTVIGMYKELEKQQEAKIGDLKAEIESLKTELMRDEGEALE